MGTLLATVLPLALGAAVSPTLFTLEVLVLSGRRHPVSRGWAVAGGSAVMLVLYTVLGLTVLEHVVHHRGHSATDAAIDLGAALLLALLAIRALRRHPTAAENHNHKASRMLDAPTAAFWGLGALAMLVNFSTLVLYLAALHQVSHSSVDLDEKVVAGLVLLLITLLPVLLPVTLVAVLGHRADPVLSRVNGFVGRHGRAITAGIEVVFCLVLLFKGIGELP
ncbi:MAG: GAP family protein [Acidimicrobiales bacterium]